MEGAGNCPDDWFGDLWIDDAWERMPAMYLVTQIYGGKNRISLF